MKDPATIKLNDDGTVTVILDENTKFDCPSLARAQDALDAIGQPAYKMNVPLSTLLKQLAG